MSTNNLYQKCTNDSSVTARGKKLDNLGGGGILIESGRKLFNQMKDSSKVDIEHFREFRKGVRNEGKVFKARKEKGVLRKTLIEMG